MQHRIRQRIQVCKRMCLNQLQRSNGYIKTLASDVRRTSRQRLYGRRVSPQALKHLQDSLLVEAVFDANYVVLTVGSCAIATFGLLANSAAVIIGAMIIAPLMLPIRCLAFGILEGEAKLVRRGLVSVGLATLIAVTLSSMLGGLSGLVDYGSEVLARSKPNLLDLGVAVAAGGISGFAKVRPKISNALAGTAIAVALMPPICVVGLGLSQMRWPLSLGASILYLTNLLGITLACMLAFLITGYTPLMRARKGLGLALVFTSILLVPLGISFVQLVRQNQLEASLRRALVDRTITFQRVQLIDSQTNWLTTPPEVRLIVVSSENLTPKQVRLLEEFVAKELGRSFTLIFEISQLQEVRREEKLHGGGR